MSSFDKTNKQFDKAMSLCRDIFEKKLKDYGASWRILRPTSLTDQLFIKAKRIRSLETSGISLVGEGILPEFKAIVNYSIIGIIQLQKGYADKKDMDAKDALTMYDSISGQAIALMKDKNHDYGEAWRDMRVSSFTDIILTKLERIREIEDNDGATQVSEGIESNYLDILNYAIFAIIKLDVQ